MSDRLYQISNPRPDMNPSSERVQERRRPPGIRFQLVEIGTRIGDFFIIGLASILSGVGYQQLFLEAIGDIGTFAAVGAIVFVNFFALTSAQGNYRPGNLTNAGRQFRYVTLNWLFVFSFLAAIAFAMKITASFSRGSTISFFFLGLSGLLLFRFMLSRYLKKAMAAGAFAEQRIVLISERALRSVSHALEELQRCGYSPVQTFELSTAEADGTGVPSSLRHKMEAVVSACQTEKVDYVFLLLKWNRTQLIKNLTQLLRTLPIPVHLIPDENVSMFLASRRGDIGTTFTVELQRAPLNEKERILKRAFDIVAASVILVMLSPLMLLTASMIKFDSRGPVFFRQRRNGFNGRVFWIYKFRSMRVLEDGDVIKQASKEDPRVTRIGRWIRRTSIDELPQLLNVLTGDMSLVGPRPHAVAHNNEYQAIVGNYAFRHHVKPGITGWAQVKGYRGETATLDLMQQRVEHDLWYINHWSFWLDIRILLMTTMAAARQPAAY